MIEATLHPAEHIFDPFLNLSAECQAERWIVRRLAAAGFEIERAGPLGGPDVLAGRWSREELPGGAWRFRQWPAVEAAILQSFDDLDAYRAAEDVRKVVASYLGDLKSRGPIETWPA